jgi:hypothetical protein
MQIPRALAIACNTVRMGKTWLNLLPSPTCLYTSLARLINPVPFTAHHFFLYPKT